ncbi:MAG: NAD(P)/FAD-dependent oxidoreductase [Opitutales bacterium]
MPKAEGTDPILIVGQGLAGTCLAWMLEERQTPFHLLDGGDPHAAWPAAAGIINPVTGKRFNRSWAVDGFLPRARDFYRAVGERLGVALWHPHPLLRALRTTGEAQRWAERANDPAYTPYLGERIPAGKSESGLRSPDGAVWIRQAAQVDVATLVTRSRRRWERAGRLERGTLDAEALSINQEAGYIQWNHRSWSAVVFADGRLGAENRWFSWLDYRLSRGEVLEAEAGDLPDDRILNGGVWTLPVGDSRIRTGSTYTWTDLDAGPTEAGRREILSQLEALTDRRAGRILDQRAGIRPGTHDSRPYLGQHPEAPGIWIFNGLGSKGTLYAPGCAEHLTDALTDDKPLPPELDVSRRLKFKRPGSRPTDEGDACG